MNHQSSRLPRRRFIDGSGVFNLVATSQSHGKWTEVTFRDDCHSKSETRHNNQRTLQPDDSTQLNNKESNRKLVRKTVKSTKTKSQAESKAKESKWVLKMGCEGFCLTSGRRCDNRMTDCVCNYIVVDFSTIRLGLSSVHQSSYPHSGCKCATRTHKTLIADHLSSSNPVI